MNQQHTYTAERKKQLKRLDLYKRDIHGKYEKNKPITSIREQNNIILNRALRLALATSSANFDKLGAVIADLDNEKAQTARLALQELEDTLIELICYSRNNNTKLVTDCEEWRIEEIKQHDPELAELLQDRQGYIC